MYESQLAQLTQQTFNMESAALATENLRNTMATVDAMKQANKELKKQYGKIDIDKIEVRVIPSCMGDIIAQAARITRTERALRYGGLAGTSERDSGDSRSLLCRSRRD